MFYIGPSEIMSFRIADKNFIMTSFYLCDEVKLNQKQISFNQLIKTYYLFICSSTSL